jgi:hypothetical protein
VAGWGVLFGCIGLGDILKNKAQFLPVSAVLPLLVRVIFASNTLSAPARLLTSSQRTAILSDVSADAVLVSEVFGWQLYRNKNARTASKEKIDDFMGMGRFGVSFFPNVMTG